MKYKLEDISLKISKGSTPRGKVNYSSDENNLFLRVTDLSELQHIETAEYTLSDDDIKKNKMKIWPSNTVLVSIEGTVGKVAMLKKPMAFNQAIAGIIPDEEKVIPEYLMYYLRQTPTISSILKGTIMPALRLGDLSSIELDLPDLRTQQKIVRVLSAFDQKIELNNKISDNLLRVAHQIYINDIKSLPTVKTEKLGSLCKIKYGKGLPTSKILKSGYRVYGGNGIIGFYNEKMYDKSQVLISCRGAASGKVIFTRPDCFVTNNSLILECKDKHHYFVKEFSLDREYYDYTTGSAQPQITIDSIKDIELSVPDDETLMRLNATLRPLEERYFTILEENETLTKTRDTLLSKLISGEISLKKVTV